MPDNREFTVIGSSLILRGCSCGVTLNAHVPTDGKSDDTKDSLYEKPECVYGEKMFLNNQSGGMHIGYWWESQKERDH
jgi:hypothetical protein